MKCKPEVDAHTEECIKGIEPCDAEMERWSAEAYAEMDADDDRDERSRAGQALQGVCKDCNAGTLNNDLYEVFYLISGNDDNEVYACKNCGSRHLDLLF